MKSLYNIGALFALLNSSSLYADEQTSEVNDNSKACNPSHLSPLDYTYGYWLNSRRKAKESNTKDILSFESGYFGFNINLDDFTRSKYTLFTEPSTYQTALKLSNQRQDQLEDAEVIIEVQTNGITYQAKSCEAGVNNNLREAPLWESGRLLQHFELQGLKFKDQAGTPLPCSANLDLVMWPDNMTFTADITPTISYSDGYQVGVKGTGISIINQPTKLTLPEGTDSEQFTLAFWVWTPKQYIDQPPSYLLAMNGGENSDGFIGFENVHGKVVAKLNINKQAHSINNKKNTLQPDQWQQLVVSYDGADMKYYVNGVLNGTKNIGGKRTTRNKNLTLYLGQMQAYRNISRGVYDQIRIWNKALPASDIKAAYDTPGSRIAEDALKFEEQFDQHSFTPVLTPKWKNTTVTLKLKGAKKTFSQKLSVKEPWSLNETKKITLHCPVDGSQHLNPDISIKVSTKNKDQFDTVFSKQWNSYTSVVKKLKRKWKTGYNDIRNYDEFDISIKNTSDKIIKVPHFLDLYDVANVTGVCPILCYADGTPTGIPVQLSKNWHHQRLPSYLRTFTLIPVPPGETKLKLRLAYGFYGSLPSASHAQLSLVGYGGHARWDQLAIGCWGETMCFDTDMSLVDVAVTDVRLLMTRDGQDGKKWSWTDAGWGGDWLGVRDANKRKLAFSGLKAKYTAHGPCLTEAEFQGYYGEEKDVTIHTQLRTLRTDDYARTFQKLTYRFNKNISAKDSWLFKVGRTHRVITPSVAYGNTEGLIKHLQIPSASKSGELVLNKTVPEGKAPWWIGFPDGYIEGDHKGPGTRAIIVRSYSAHFAGVHYPTPSFSTPLHRTETGDKPNLDILLTAPAEITEYKVGDEVSFVIEWITLPRKVEDYYGPNKSFAKFLAKNPNSWKTIHREVVKNNLEIQVTGGTLVENYPIIVKADKDIVSIDIKGGCGAVPLRFDHLDSAIGYQLYQEKNGKLELFSQAVHGNDFWQTDFDSASNTYSITYNLPLDELPHSKWVLKKKK